MQKEYFNEIFENVKTLIIPGLGAFTKSGNDFSFNPFLKFNDGFLVSFIAKKKGIAVDTAGDQVADAVAKIQEALTLNGEAVVIGLGKLIRRNDNNYDFVFNNNDEALNKSEIKQSTFENKLQNSSLKENSVITSDKTLEINEPKQEKMGLKKSVVNIETPVLTEVQTNTKENKTVNEKKQKDKKKVAILPIIIAIFIIIGGTFAIFKWDMVKSWMGNSTTNLTQKETKKQAAEKKTEKINEPAQISDSTLIDTVEKSNELSVQEPAVEEIKSENSTTQKNISPVNVSSRNYHVITGCFTNPEFAQRMLDKLIAEGNQAINLGQHGGYYLISAGDYSNVNEATSKLQTLKMTYPKAWLYNGL